MLDPKQCMEERKERSKIYNSADEESNENVMGLKTFILNISETPNCCTERKPPIFMVEGFNSVLYAFIDGKTRGDSSDAHFSSQPTKFKQKKEHMKFSSNLTTICEGDGSYLVKAKDEEYKLLESNWYKWMDEP